jgi:hypothetical protein
MHDLQDLQAPHWIWPWASMRLPRGSSEVGVGELTLMDWTPNPCLTCGREMKEHTIADIMECSP